MRPHLRFALAVSVALYGLLCMAPNRRQFDHIGNFNFKVVPVGQQDGTVYLDAAAPDAEPHCFTTETEAVRLRFVNPLTQAQLAALDAAGAVVVSGAQASVRFDGAHLEEYFAISPVGPVALVSYASCE